VRLIGRRVLKVKTRAKSIAVTVAGGILLLVAMLFAIALIGAVVEERPNRAIGLTLGLLVTVPFAYTGAAMIWRWRHYRLKARAFSWVMIGFAVLGGILGVREGESHELLLAIIIVALFGFVLWALRCETETNIA
jgi:MFS family permease